VLHHQVVVEHYCQVPNIKIDHFLRPFQFSQCECYVMAVCMRGGGGEGVPH
jgi:hypothetical protein